MKHTLPLILLLILCLVPHHVSGQSAIPVGVERTSLFGIGGANILDTYLSPLNYCGTTLSYTLLTERAAHFGKGRLTVIGRYDINGTLAHPAADNSEMWDGTLTAGGGLRYHWQPAPGLRLSAGGLCEISAGGTYRSRGGNNPAQGRVGADLAASLAADYAFRVGQRTWHARLMADVPVVGLTFAPHYGASYYEMFALNHRDGICRVTTPCNAPTARLMATLSIPIRRARLVIGYQGDVRQSNIYGLKRHCWRNELLIGFTRTLQLLP